MSSIITIATFLFLFVFSQCFSTDKPLIGILTLPCSNLWCSAPNTVDLSATTYFPASYVKWVESGGGRVVPIMADSSPSIIQALLPQLNGVVITGGSQPFTDGNLWWDSLQIILIHLRDYATKEHAIPLWFTCLGFEAVVNSMAGTTDVVQSFISEDNALPINFANNVLQNSRIFGSFMDKAYAKSVFDKLSTENLTMNFHSWGISPSSFSKYPLLNGNLSILGTSLDESGKAFATLVESVDDGFLYWYGSQFHPEKPAFVFDYKKGVDMVHSLDGIYVNEYFAEFFVNECRLRNQNSMVMDVYNTHVIFNYVPYFMYNGTHSYEQIYLFQKPLE